MFTFQTHKLHFLKKNLAQTFPFLEKYKKRQMILKLCSNQTVSEVVYIFKSQDKFSTTKKTFVVATVHVHVF